MIQIVYINCNCIKEEPLSRIFWKFQKIFPKTINSSAYNSRWIHVWLEVYLDISIYFPENFVENSRDSFLIHFLHLIKNSAWLVENWRRKVWNYFPQKWITVTDTFWPRLTLCLFIQTFIIYTWSTWVSKLNLMIAAVVKKIQDFNEKLLSIDQCDKNIRNNNA